MPNEGKVHLAFAVSPELYTSRADSRHYKSTALTVPLLCAALPPLPLPYAAAGSRRAL